MVTKAVGARVRIRVRVRLRLRVRLRVRSRLVASKVGRVESVFAQPILLCEQLPRPLDGLQVRKVRKVRKLGRLGRLGS